MKTGSKFFSPKMGLLDICDVIRVTIETSFGHSIGFTIRTQLPLIIRIIVENFGLFPLCSGSGFILEMFLDQFRLIFRVQSVFAL